MLANLFHKFRNVCIERYALDPAHDHKAPGLSWDALLKKMKVELELLILNDMHLFVEQELRGGISIPSKRYAKENSKCLKDYYPDKPSVHIVYLDVNNLYGWARCFLLLVHGFEWSKGNSRSGGDNREL